MKYIMMILMCVGMSFNSQASSAKQRLIGSMISKQKRAEATIVSMVMQEKSGDELIQEVEDYISREIRLKAMNKGANTGTLFDRLSRRGVIADDSPEGLAHMMVTEYLKSKNADISGKQFVCGRYQIKLRD